MSKALKKLKKHWITVWLVVAVLAMTSIVVYASFTRVTVAKRVISTTAGAGTLFSSNYMGSGTLRTAAASYYENNEGAAIVNLYVYNYAAPKKIPFFKDDNLEYTLNARLVKDVNGTELTEHDKSVIDGNGTDDNPGLVYKIGETSLNQSNDYSVSISKNLGKTQSANDVFDLIFDRAELDDTEAPGYCIYVEAVPAIGLDLPTLKGYVGVRKNEIVDPGWKGNLLEEEKNSTFDGYNYELSGNGIGYLTITWYNDVLEPNDFIYADPGNTFVTGDITSTPTLYNGGQVGLKNTVVTQNENTSSIVLKMDSSAGKVRQVIQFYKKYAEKEYTLDQVRGYISYKWTPLQ